MNIEIHDIGYWYDIFKEPILILYLLGQYLYGFVYSIDTTLIEYLI